MEFTNISDNLFNRLLNMNLTDFDKTLDNIINFKYRKLEMNNNIEMTKCDININNINNVNKHIYIDNINKHIYINNIININNTALDILNNSQHCKISNCRNKQYKDKICIYHYKKNKNNICAKDKCNNIRYMRHKSREVCYKHYKKNKNNICVLNNCTNVIYLRHNSRYVCFKHYKSNI